MSRLGAVFCVSGIVVLLGLKPAVRHHLVIRFRNCAANHPLSLTGERYANSFGETFSVQQFKYYVSAIRAGGGREEEMVLKEAHLVDESDSSSLVLNLSTTLERVRTISFIVGVDSLANTGGVQGGDLDPMLGMFWTWNTGYVYARLEGESDSAHSPAHRFTWDIGGYKDPSNALRTVTLKLGAGNGPAGGGVQGTDAEGEGAGRDEGGDKKVILITADILKWFDGKTPVHLASSPVCHQPGALAMRIADNYSTMFSVVP